MQAKVLGSASILLACGLREQDAHTTNLHATGCTRMKGVMGNG